MKGFGGSLGVVGFLWVFVGFGGGWEGKGFEAWGLWGLGGVRGQRLWVFARQRKG